MKRRNKEGAFCIHPQAAVFESSMSRRAVAIIRTAMLSTANRWGGLLYALANRMESCCFYRCKFMRMRVILTGSVLAMHTDAACPLAPCRTPDWSITFRPCFIKHRASESDEFRLWTPAGMRIFRLRMHAAYAVR